ncbi:MAG: lipopolysaccharide transport periplasmic protein LptA [Thiohalorhabdaceae bacterium]
MDPKSSARWSPLLAALVLATGALAQGSLQGGDDEAPLVVESNEMVIRDADQEAVYTGDVVATKGAMTLRSDRLVVTYTETGIQRAHAYGDPVTMDQGERHGRASEAIYKGADRSLLLIGNAYLEEGPNTLEGARIRYYLDSRRTEAFGGDDGEGRARAVFQPGEPPEGDNGESEGGNGP